MNSLNVFLRILTDFEDSPDIHGFMVLSKQTKDLQQMQIGADIGII